MNRWDRHWALLRRANAREYRDTTHTATGSLLWSALAWVLLIGVAWGLLVLLTPEPVPLLGGLVGVAAGSVLGEDVVRVRLLGGRAYRRGWATFRPTRPELPLRVPPPGPPPGLHRAHPARPVAVPGRLRVLEPSPTSAQEAAVLAAALLRAARADAVWLRIDPAPARSSHAAQVLGLQRQVAPHLPPLDERWRPYDLEDTTDADWDLAVALAPLCREVVVHEVNGGVLRLRDGARTVVVDADDRWTTRLAELLPPGVTLVPGAVTPA